MCSPERLSAASETTNSMSGAVCGDESLVIGATIGFDYNRTPQSRQGSSDLTEPDFLERVVARLAQHQPGPIAGGTDVLAQVDAVDLGPDPLGRCDRVICG